jgi:hypothetical protein
LYKPDETAEGIAQKIARGASPPADFNANSVVIHDLQRVGAPGLVDIAGSAAPDAAPPAGPEPVSIPSVTAASLDSPRPETASVVRPGKEDAR